MMFFYNLVIRLYTMAIHLAAIRGGKAALWVKGRKNWENILVQKLKPYQDRKKIWFHCASLGEFEQGRPMMEALKKKHPEYCIVISFFSPSGYEVQKNYTGADVICYLPADSKKNAATFLEFVNPAIIIFIKYEFWLYYLRAIKQKGLQAYLVSAVFKPHHPFFRWYGNIFIQSLKAFRTLFVQDTRSAELLQTIGFTNVEITGDTRFDRVMEIKDNFTPVKEIEAFKNGQPLLIAGSTWPGDLELILGFYKNNTNPSLKLLIAPHEIDEKSITKVITGLEQNQIKYSIYAEGINNARPVLVLNTMGMLSKVYGHADMAYIGGGFNNGLHNCLEAAVYGIPVVFYGEDFIKYNEAVELVELGVAANVKNIDDLNKQVSVFLENNKATEVKKVLQNYFSSKPRVTDQVFEKITWPD